ncbi:hypothetical protein BCV72DRAFT_329495 [Rhizopus microsporus var. microsporus]|uniref:Uncharacterized protein n=1 Tax=Rhizopus microsporus var. microsporus TaxID=86635 RepID=A0A1X0R2B3_RHIZD|nr:hypothetical protein BCV72DRAFT_329495 [Rhizopus microsporus var. microsporus]
MSTIISLEALMISLFCLYRIIPKKLYCKSYVKAMVQEIQELQFNAILMKG